jgi:hypothetical protein
VKDTSTQTQKQKSSQKGVYSWRSSSKRSSQDFTNDPSQPSRSNESKRLKSQSPKSSTSKSSSSTDAERESWAAVSTDAKDILSEYYEACKEQHSTMLERIKNVKTAFYAEVGRLTIDKDKKLKELYNKHKISFEGALLLELPLYVNNDMEEVEDTKHKQVYSQENEKSSSPRINEVEESSVAEFYNEDVGTQDSLNRPFNLATPPKNKEEDEDSV